MRIAWLLSATFLAITASPAHAEDDADAVRRTFSEYRSAILSGEGDSAAALLSQSTYDYYDEMRQLALFGDAAEVQSQSLVNQMQVLIYRLRVPVDTLESLSPRELIAHAVDKGWIGKDSVLKLQPGKVLSEGNIAALHVTVDGQDAGPMFRFNRESGKWRLDLVPTMQATNVAMQMAAKQQGLSDEEFMVILMESVMGRKVGAEAWVPPRAKRP